MPSPPRYYERKALGLCVRCNRQAEDGRVLCVTHRQLLQAYHRDRTQREEADRSWMLSAPRQPVDREKWDAPARPLPPLPTSCPKCAAGLVPCYVELYLRSEPAVRCLNCGYLTDRQMLQNKLEALHEDG